MNKAHVRSVHFVQTIEIRHLVSYCTEPNMRRLPAAQPNGALIAATTVAAVSGSSYDVTLAPYECGDKLPLFELSNAKVKC